MVERLFSIAKHIITPERSRLTLKLFNSILFLREHMDLWDEVELDICINYKNICVAGLTQNSSTLGDNELFLLDDSLESIAELIELSED